MEKEYRVYITVRAYIDCERVDREYSMVVKAADAEKASYIASGMILRYSNAYISLVSLNCVELG